MTGSSPSRDPDPVRDPEHVSIDGQPGNAKRMPEHDVRGLAADARQRGQLLHVGRHVAAVLGDEHLRHADQRLGLLPEEPGRQDQPLELGCVGPRQRPRVRIALEQRRRDHVHALVRGLRRQDRGGEQLEGVAVVQFGVGVRMLLGERLDDPASRGRGLHASSDFSGSGPLLRPPDVGIGLGEDAHVLLQRGNQVRHELDRHDHACPHRAPGRRARSRLRAAPSPRAASPRRRSA